MTRNQRDELLSSVSFSNASEIVDDIDVCFFGRTPTLAELNRMFGAGTDKMWLTEQLIDLSEYAGVKNKIEKRSLEDLVMIISTSYHFLKMSELILFFYRFKRGDYEQFYGSIDPMAITRSLRSFLSDRGAMIDRKVGEETKARANERSAGAISREEYDAGLKSGKYKPYKPEKYG